MYKGYFKSKFNYMFFINNSVFQFNLVLLIIFTNASLKAA